MKEQCGYFINLEQKSFCYKKLPIKSSAALNRRPFFSILNEDSTVKLFFDALRRNSTEEAFCYMSRSLPTNIDLHELRRVLDTGSDYKYLITANNKLKANNCRTNSVLIINKENCNSIIHIYMVREPDSFGNWKIFGIEKE